MSIQNAINCFTENLRMCGQPNPANPQSMEKYNLYSGLLSLAEAVRQIEFKVTQIT